VLLYLRVSPSNGQTVENSGRELQEIKLYAYYHNRVRTHLSLDKDASIHHAAHHAETIVAIPMLGGLHHHYVRIWFSVDTGAPFGQTL
jgi:hypothetical protein